MLIVKLLESEQFLLPVFANVSFWSLFFVDVVVELKRKSGPDYDAKKVERLVVVAGIGEVLIVVDVKVLD